MKTLKVNQISKRELLFLNSLSVTVLAARMFVPPETIDLWCRYGMPCFFIGKEKYFHYPEVMEWLESEDKNTGKSINDLLWEVTPERLLPQSIELRENNILNLPAGKYWVVKINHA